MRLRLTGFIIFILTLHVNSQIPTVLRSTFSIGGSSTTVSSKGHKAVVLQSIGQQSVSGVFSGNKMELRQGYLQPVIGFKPTEISEEENIKVWPNPFVSEINIKPDRIISGNVELIVTDLTGRVVYRGNQPSGGQITANLDFLARGLYILRIRNKNLLFNCKIAKD